MTEQELANIEARADAATRGPWRAVNFPTGGSQVYAPSLDNFNVVRSAPRQADAEFIAASREDVPALLAEVRFLRGLLADLALDGKDVQAAERLRRLNADLVRLFAAGQSIYAGRASGPSGCRFYCDAGTAKGGGAAAVGDDPLDVIATAISRRLVGLRRGEEAATA